MFICAKKLDNCNKYPPIRGFDISVFFLHIILPEKGGGFDQFRRPAINGYFGDFFAKSHSTKMPKRARHIGRKELSPYSMFTSYNDTAGEKRINPQYIQWCKDQRQKQQTLAREIKQEKVEKKKKAKATTPFVAPEAADEEEAATPTPP